MSTVVLASADGLYRAGVASLLRGAGFSVVEVADLPAAVAASREHEAEVCVFDTDMDEGAAATRRLAAGSSARIVALASQRRESDVLGVIRNGGSGFVPKTANGDGLVRAVRAVLAGQLAIPRDSIATLVGELRAGPRRTAVGARRIDLTSRERNVFDLLEHGLTTQEMAARLGISTVTVRRHLGAIAAKAGTRGVARLRLLLEA